MSIKDIFKTLVWIIVALFIVGFIRLKCSGSLGRIENGLGDQKLTSVNKGSINEALARGWVDITVMKTDSSHASVTLMRKGGAEYIVTFYSGVTDLNMVNPPIKVSTDSELALNLTADHSSATVIMSIVQ